MKQTTGRDILDMIAIKFVELNDYVLFVDEYNKLMQIKLSKKY